MEWFDIKGYEENYQVNKKGEIRNKKTGKILKQGVGKIGYPVVSLWKNNKGKTHNVHRILAEHFIPNPENKREVNHIDGIKHNNDLSNLEWATPSENIKHAYNKGLNYMSDKGKKNISEAISKRNKILKARSKKVLQYDMKGNFLKEYESAKQAAKENNLSFGMVSSLCTGKKGSKKYKFKYKGVN